MLLFGRLRKLVYLWAYKFIGLFELINETRSEVFENSQQTMYNKAHEQVKTYEKANKPKKQWNHFM